jgi:hypothetical protein
MIMTCKTTVQHAGSPHHTELWSCAPRWKIQHAYWMWGGDGNTSSDRGWWVGYGLVWHINIDIQEEKMAISFYLYSELNVVMDNLHMANKESLSASPVLGVRWVRYTEVTELAEETWGLPDLPQILHIQVGSQWKEWWTHSHTCICSLNALLVSAGYRRQRWNIYLKCWTYSELHGITTYIIISLN